MEVMEKEDGVRGMGMNHSTIVNVNPIPLHSTFFCWTQTEKKEEKGKTEKQLFQHVRANIDIDRLTDTKARTRLGTRHNIRPSTVSMCVLVFIQGTMLNDTTHILTYSQLTTSPTTKRRVCVCTFRAQMYNREIGRAHV